MGKGKLWPSANQKPKTPKPIVIWMAWLRRGRLPPKNLGSIRPGVFALHINEIYTLSGRNFLHLFWFLNSPTGESVRPSFTLNTSNDAVRDKIGYNSACVRFIYEIVCICGGVFENGPSNAANWILPRPTLVAIATKFKTKWAVHNGLVQQISPRSLHLMEVRVEGKAIRWHQFNSWAVRPNR